MLDSDWSDSFPIIVVSSSVTLRILRLLFSFCLHARAKCPFLPQLLHQLPVVVASAPRSCCSCYISSRINSAMSISYFLFVYCLNISSHCFSVKCFFPVRCGFEVQYFNLACSWVIFFFGELIVL